jgi:hypothetical protein
MQLKSAAEGYALQNMLKHHDRLTKALEAQQKRQAEQMEIDAAMNDDGAEQTEQNELEKQEQEKERQLQQDQQKLVQAVGTPAGGNFVLSPIRKPETMKEARVKRAGRFSWMSPLARKAFQGGAGVGTGLFWDNTFYGPQYDTTGDWFKSLATDQSPSRLLGLGLSGATGGYGGNRILKGFSGPGKLMERVNRGFNPAVKNVLGYNIGLPALERGMVLGVTEGLPNMFRNQRLKGELLAKEMAGGGAGLADRIKQEVDDAVSKAKGSDVPWGWILGLGGAGLAGLAANQIYANRMKEKELELKKNPPPAMADRIALEIPSEKISDALYNNIGREILFKHRGEESPPKQANVFTKQASLASFDDIDKIVEDRRTNGILKESADDIPDGPIKGLRYGYTLEVDGKTYETKQGVRCTRKYCGGPEDFIAKEGKVFEVFDVEDSSEEDSAPKQANVKWGADTELTMGEAYSNLSPPALGKWLRDSAPATLDSLTAQWGPLIAAFGGPNIGHLATKMQGAQIPSKPGRKDPWVQNQWGRTKQIFDHGFLNVPWTPGHQVTLSPTQTAV